MESLKRQSLKKASFTAPVTSEFDDMASTESYIIPGCCVNDKKVETRVDRYVYRNGNVLSKVYQNDHLRMIRIAKA